MSAEKPLIIDPRTERYLQAGRICSIVYGKDAHRLVCVVDFIDRNRVLIDGARGTLSKIKRCSYPIRWLQVTKYRLPLKRDTPEIPLVKAVKASKVKSVWRQSSAGRRDLCVRSRENLDDFGRFKLHYLKGQFKRAVAKELFNLRANATNERKKNPEKVEAKGKKEDGKGKKKEVKPKPKPKKEKKGETPLTGATLRAREQLRLRIHPTLRRVTGSFQRKLEAKVALKQRRRRRRLLKQGRNFGKLTRRRFKEREEQRKAQKAQKKEAQPPSQPAQQ